MSIILGVYLAGLFWTSGYGAGSCYATNGNHVVGPEMCAALTTAGAVIWPALVVGEVANKIKK